MSSIWDILPQRQSRQQSLTPCVIPNNTSSAMNKSNAVSTTSPVMQQVKMSSDSNVKKPKKEKEKKSFLSMPPAAGEESDTSSDSGYELHDDPKELMKHIVKIKPPRAGIMEFLQRRSNSLTIEKASRLK